MMGVNINVLTLVALTSGTKDPKILLDTSEFVPKTFYVGCGTRSTCVRASREAYLNRLEYTGVYGLAGARAKGWPACARRRTG